MCRTASSVSIIVAIAFALTIPLSATAQDLVAFDFEGTVLNAVDFTGLSISLPSVGSLISGTYIFDATTPDAAPEVSGAGFYDDAVQCMWVDWQGGGMLELALGSPPPAARATSTY